MFGKKDNRILCIFLKIKDKEGVELSIDVNRGDVYVEKRLELIV